MTHFPNNTTFGSGLGPQLGYGYAQPGNFGRVANYFHGGGYAGFGGGFPASDSPMNQAIANMKPYSGLTQSQRARVSIENLFKELEGMLRAENITSFQGSDAQLVSMHGRSAIIVDGKQHNLRTHLDPTDVQLAMKTAKVEKREMAALRNDPIYTAKQELVFAMRAYQESAALGGGIASDQEQGRLARAMQNLSVKAGVDVNGDGVLSSLDQKRLNSLVESATKQAGGTFKASDITAALDSAREETMFKLAAAKDQDTIRSLSLRLDTNSNGVLEDGELKAAAQGYESAEQAELIAAVKNNIPADGKIAGGYLGITEGNRGEKAEGRVSQDLERARELLGRGSYASTSGSRFNESSVMAAIKSGAIPQNSEALSVSNANALAGDHSFDANNANVPGQQRGSDSVSIVS